MANMEIKRGINKPNVHSFFPKWKFYFWQHTFHKLSQIKFSIKYKKVNIILPKTIILKSQIYFKNCTISLDHFLQVYRLKIQSIQIITLEQYDLDKKNSLLTLRISALLVRHTKPLLVRGEGSSYRQSYRNRQCLSRKSIHRLSSQVGKKMSLHLWLSSQTISISSLLHLFS